MAVILNEGYRENELEYCKNVIKVFFLSLVQTPPPPPPPLPPPPPPQDPHYFNSPIVAFKGATMQLSPGLAVFGTPWDDWDDLTSPVLHPEELPSWIPVTSGWRCSFFTRDMEVSLFGYDIHVHVYIYTPWKIDILNLPRYGGLLERWCSFSHC